MNRAHTATEGQSAVYKAAQDAGITNLTADLIYAIPAPDHTLLTEDIQKAEPGYRPYIGLLPKHRAPNSVWKLGEVKKNESD